MACRGGLQASLHFSTPTQLAGATGQQPALQQAHQEKGLFHEAVPPTALETLTLKVGVVT